MRDKWMSLNDSRPKYLSPGLADADQSDAGIKGQQLPCARLQRRLPDGADLASTGNWLRRH